MQAAFKGSLASVEWFLSDAPERHYKDFAEAYKHHKLIAHLNTAGGGFDKVLSKWLGARRKLTEPFMFGAYQTNTLAGELALHCAVMANPRPESINLIEYLVKVMPESLEKKSREGYTPLALAISLRRLDAAKVLIKAGADQTVRDVNGANLLHLLLCSSNGSAGRDKDELKRFLELIDKRLIESLLTERSKHEPGSQTPLARWMRAATEDADVMKVILDFAAPYGNEHLEMLDGTGDTPLHYAVKSRRQQWLKLMLEYRPELLDRENSVGRTPYELAEDAYTSDCVSRVPHVTTRNSVSSVTNLRAESFVEDGKHYESVNEESIWRLCEEFMKKHPGKRRLVSLIDANEVAKRLANRHQGNVYGSRNDAESDDGEADQDTDDCTDEVSQWYYTASRS